MASSTPQDLMRSAWAKRRASFELSSREKEAALEAAREELREAVSLCRADGASVAHAHALHLLANVEVDRGHRDEARSLWEEAIGLLRDAGDPLQLAHKIRHLGDLHRSCDRLAEAGSCYSEALALYREHDSAGSLDFANAVRRMAIFREECGEKPAALALWREARALYVAAGVSLGVEEAEDRIGSLGPEPEASVH